MIELTEGWLVAQKVEGACFHIFRQVRQVTWWLVWSPQLHWSWGTGLTRASGYKQGCAFIESQSERREKKYCRDTHFCLVVVSIAIDAIASPERVHFPPDKVSRVEFICLQLSLMSWLLSCGEINFAKSTFVKWERRTNSRRVWDWAENIKSWCKDAEISSGWFSDVWPQRENRICLGNIPSFWNTNTVSLKNCF